MAWLYGSYHGGQPSRSPAANRRLPPSTHWPLPRRRPPHDSPRHRRVRQNRSVLHRPVVAGIAIAGGAPIPPATTDNVPHEPGPSAGQRQAAVIGSETAPLQNVRRHAAYQTRDNHPKCVFFGSRTLVERTRSSGRRAAHGPRLDEAGRCRTRSLYPRYEQQGTLGALLQPSSASSTLDGTLGRTRIAQSVRDLDEAYCQEPNRPVRTRMLAGVGGAPETSGPLSRSLLLGRDFGNALMDRRGPIFDEPKFGMIAKSGLSCH